MTGTSPGNGAEQGLSTTGGLLLISTTILLLGALSWGELVFAPAAFAIFIVMVVWPLQAWLQARMPKSLAILITILVTVVSIVALLLLFVWGMSVVGQWLIRNSNQFQTLYQAASDKADVPAGDVAVFPLAMPMLAGGGSIAAIVAMTDHTLKSIAEQAVTAVVMLAVMVVIYAVLRSAETIQKAIGDTGTNVMSRIMGLVLAALAVQTFFSVFGPLLGPAVYP